MNRLNLIIALTLLTANTACAASFDCTKASTKVEKMICANSELSILDEELNRAYFEAAQSLKNPDDLRGDQKIWLKYDRGGCKEVNCLLKKYNERIEYLQAVSMYDFIPSERSYPPYPDMWQASFPLKRDEKNLFIAIYKAQNGNYITYADDKYASNFFEPTVKINPKSSHAASFKLNYVKGEPEVELASGVKIAINNLDHRYFQRCPQTLNYFYTIRYPNGRVIRKSLLYQLSQPKAEEINSRCATTIENTYVEKVKAIDSNIYPLEDGGFFLIVDDLGVVLRFDSNFESKAELIGKRLFIVNTAELEKLGISKFEEMGYQPVQDAVAELINIRE